MLYKRLVTPTYASVVWSLSYRGYINSTELVQKQFLLFGHRNLGWYHGGLFTLSRYCFPLACFHRLSSALHLGRDIYIYIIGSSITFRRPRSFEFFDFTKVQPINFFFIEVGSSKLRVTLTFALDG